MSASYAYSAPLRRPREDFAPQVRPRRVQIVTTRAQRRSRPKLAYAAVATAVIFAIFLTQLLLTIALSSGAYRITGLQASGVQLGRVASSLNEKLDTLSSPQNLEANARALGMVGSPRQAFVQLSTGLVFGTPVAARAPKTLFIAKNASTDSVPNSLLATVPLINSTGNGHGDANAGDSSTNNSESNLGSSSTASASAGNSSTSGTSSNSGDLPSPVTH